MDGEESFHDLVQPLTQREGDWSAPTAAALRPSLSCAVCVCQEWSQGLALSLPLFAKGLHRLKNVS